MAKLYKFGKTKLKNEKNLRIINAIVLLFRVFAI